METLKVKQNRFGTFYVATRILMVKGKAFKVKQTRIQPNDERAKWKLSRRQMISILQHTRPEDWLFRSVGHFDAQTDGWKHDNEGWREATPQLIDWVKRQLQQFDYTIYFLAKDKDSYGNKVEPYTFEIFDISIHSFRLKPKNGIIRL